MFRIRQNWNADSTGSLFKAELTPKTMNPHQNCSTRYYWKKFPALGANERIRLHGAILENWDDFQTDAISWLSDWLKSSWPRFDWSRAASSNQQLENWSLKVILFLRLWWICQRRSLEQFWYVSGYFAMPIWNLIRLWIFKKLDPHRWIFIYSTFIFYFTYTVYHIPFSLKIIEYIEIMSPRSFLVTYFFKSIITYWRLYAMIQVEKGNLQKGIESLNKALELIKV